MQPRHSDGVFNSVGATVRKKDFRCVLKGVIQDGLRCAITRHVPVLWRNRRQDARLLLYGVNKVWVLMPHVREDRLAREI
jgi:hypothetical protein